ncbi:hypothetical protein D3C81_1744550 [compost metagenome]
MALPLRQQQPRIFERRLRVVDRARPHDHQQPVVLAMLDTRDALARLRDQRLDRRIPDGEKADQVLWRRQRDDVFDMRVVSHAGAVRR